MREAGGTAITPLGRVLVGGADSVRTRGLESGETVVPEEEGRGRRGGAIPIASCIEVTRSRVTSVPH